MLTSAMQTIISNSYGTINTNNFEKFQQKLLLILQNDVDNNLEELVEHNDFQITIMGLELIGKYHVNSNNQIDYVKINYLDNKPIN